MPSTRLIKYDVTDRFFPIQLSDIVTEFGTEIPWLQGAEHLKYITNPKIFKEELRKSLHLPSTNNIQPYMLTTNDKRQEYLGGVLVFPDQSPEKFQDPYNEIIRKQLENAKYPFVTCLQTRKDLRVGTRYGIQLFSQTIADILKETPEFWGVVSDDRLATYYKYFGIEILNERNNPDGISIAVGKRDTFKKRV